MEHGTQKILTLSMCALWLGGCLASPGNGAVLDDRDEPVLFLAATVRSSDDVDFQIQDQSTGSWNNVASANTGASPYVTDVTGVDWYVGGGTYNLPMQSRYWRNAGRVNGQRRIAADVRGNANYSGLLNTFDATSSCAADTYAAEGGFAAISKCMSSNSPEARIYMECGQDGQSCCYAYANRDYCDHGHECNSGRCEDVRGRLDKPCKDGACNGSLLCSYNDVCIDPKTETTRWIRAHTGCRPGDADCNFCADDVRGQFDDMRGDDNWIDNGDSGEDMDWAERVLRFNWKKAYSPSGQEPRYVLKHHVQGLIRTNDPLMPYAASYSDDGGGTELGTFMFFERKSNGERHLKYMHQAAKWHPSGIALLGKYVAGTDRNDNIRLFDMDRLHQNHRITIPTEHSGSAGGGLGLVKLRHGNYLAVVSPSGGDSGSTRKVRFYYIEGDFHDIGNRTGNLEDQNIIKVKKAGVWEYKQPDSWSGNYMYTENISIIPECGTGEIYVLNTSGRDGFIGNGYWLLSKVVDVGRHDRGDKLGLKVINAYHQTQAQSNCHHRSSATSYVNDRGEISLLCTERKPKNGLFDGRNERWRYKVGEF